MAFPENFISELIERNDIVSVVSDYVRLTKRSGSNMFGLCPFHSEKTPSFSVSPDKQFYHCFGCGKGGGVINFIMDIENLSYPRPWSFSQSARICRCLRKRTTPRAVSARGCWRSTAMRRASSTTSFRRHWARARGNT